MEARAAGDQLAKVAVLFVAVAALNAFQRGELAAWAKAKFLNWGDPAPSGTLTLGGLISGAAAVGAAAGATAAESAAGAGLVQVGSTKMSARFAAKWIPLASAAAADGVILSGTAWRSNATQVQLRIQHGCGGSKVYDRSCRGNPPTAVPGTSRHETGDAIDVNLSGAGGTASPEYRWLAANAARFGVHNLPGEPWHWSIDGH